MEGLGPRCFCFVLNWGLSSAPGSSSLTQRSQQSDDSLCPASGVGRRSPGSPGLQAGPWPLSSAPLPRPPVQRCRGGGGGCIAAVGTALSRRRFSAAMLLLFAASSTRLGSPRGSPAPLSSSSGAPRSPLRIRLHSRLLSPFGSLILGRRSHSPLDPLDSSRGFLQKSPAHCRGPFLGLTLPLNL